jgi:hypothetical protein
MALGFWIQALDHAAVLINRQSREIAFLHSLQHEVVVIVVAVVKAYFWFHYLLKIPEVSEIG